MARRLPGDAAHQFRTTDHREEIIHLRAVARTSSDKLIEVIFETAAELLQSHDETGISLDEWEAPRTMVELLLGEPILRNNV